MKKLLTITVVLTLLLSSLALAARVEKVTEIVKAETAGKIVFEADLGAGEFNITPKKMSELAVVDINYSPRDFDYEVVYDERRSTGYLTMECSTRDKHDIDVNENEWDISLSNGYPMDITMDIGACDANFELGGLSIESFHLDVGAASGLIEFSEKNPVRMNEFSIDAGASSLELINLGNANFEELKFSGGVGSFEIDLRGEYAGESRVDIEIGLGSADIVLPRDVPVRIETSGSNWLSSIDFDKRNLIKVDDDIYESEDFDEARVRIVLELDVGLGSIDIYWKK